MGVRKKSNQFYAKEIETVNQRIKYFEKTSESLQIFSKSVNEVFGEKLRNSDTVRQHLTKKIEKAYNNGTGFLIKEDYDQMVKKVKDATDFDPIFTTSFGEITANTKK